MAEGTELAKAYVQIIPSAQGIKSRITREIGGDDIGHSAGLSIGEAIKKALMAAGIGLAAKKIFSDAFNFGGELQQNLGGTEAVFGQFASKIQATAQEAYKNMGLSASEYMATANKMGSLFQGSGIEQQKALDMTSAAMQRAADVASVMGIDTTMAMESIAGAAKGNFTMMDNLGVAMNATTLQAYALEKGINFEWNTASNAEKAELAMQMFMERTTQYAGNFARESEETWTGSIGAMKAAYADLMANIMMGNDIGSNLDNVVATVITFVQNNLLPAMVNVMSALPGAMVTLVTRLAPALFTSAVSLVQQLGEGIVAAAPQIYEKAVSLVMQLGTGIVDAAPQIYEKAVSIIENVKSAIQENLPGLVEKGVEIASNLISGIASYLPQVLTTVGELRNTFITTIVEMLPEIVQLGTDLISNLLNGISNNLPQIITTAQGMISSFLDTVLTALPTVLQIGVDLLSNIVNGIINNLPQIVEAAGNILTTFLEVVTAALPSILKAGVDLLTNIVNGIINNLPQIIDAAGDMLASFLDAIIDALPSILQAGVDLLINIVNGIINNLPQIVGAANNLVAKLLSTILENLPKLLEAGIKLIGQLAAGLIRAIPNLVAQIPQIISAIRNSFSNVNWLEIGINIIRGIANGIRGFAGEIMSAARDAAASALDTAKNFLGINSPSKVFELQVGKNIALGMSEGISKNLSPINKAVELAKNESLSPLNDALQSAVTISPTREENNREQNVGQLIYLLEKVIYILQNKKDIPINLNDREIARVLKEMGVVFN